ncbi:hypothetical protein CTAYLR_005390 [Chrysophaeum taylorii]|uniref:DUF218 domain-containing protein n=1 Tax=Chrysophaeum taylorii TaxID=2483200 RepID=A0AAD7U938_9STRA|nr:hypothetical protein CTAYLR_005390 [Chrysophaeum taylorii]
MVLRAIITSQQQQRRHGVEDEEEEEEGEEEDLERGGGDRKKARRRARPWWMLVVAGLFFGGSAITSRAEAPPSSYQKPVVAFNATGVENLVMVAGHAVTITESLNGVDRNDRHWYLLDYQRGKDLPGEFVAHVRKGVEMAHEDERALLVFSGGQTRSDAGPRSEAQSYYFIAEHFGWWGHPDVAARTATEEFARDSFENVLFSLCRFAEIANDTYPRRVAVVSFDFKRRRFADVHAKALRLPNFRYVPMNPHETNPESRFDRREAEDGERRTLRTFLRDPFGCGRVLARKRQSRDPFRRSVPYGPRCPAMAPLLTHCGPTASFNHTLPWDNTS